MAASKHKIINIKKQKGVTLVEIIFVVTLISILTGITVMLINPERQRDTAEDGVKRANMSKICTAIETYYEGEGQLYPEKSTEANGNPLHSSATGTFKLAAIYIKEWPSEFVYNTNGGRTAFSVHVPQSGTNNYFKCNNSWREVRECGPSTVLTDINDCQ